MDEDPKARSQEEDTVSYIREGGPQWKYRGATCEERNWPLSEPRKPACGSEQKDAHGGLPKTEGLGGCVMWADTRDTPWGGTLEPSENTDVVCSVPGTQWVPSKDTSRVCRPLREGAGVRELRSFARPAKLEEAFTVRRGPSRAFWARGGAGSVPVLPGLRAWWGTRASQDVQVSLLGPREDEELGGGARGASYRRCQAWVGVGQVEPTRWRPR